MAAASTDPARTDRAVVTTARTRAEARRIVARLVDAGVPYRDTRIVAARPLAESRRWRQATLGAVAGLVVTALVGWVFFAGSVGGVGGVIAALLLLLGGMLVGGALAWWLASRSDTEPLAVTVPADVDVPDGVADLDRRERTP